MASSSNPSGSWTSSNDSDDPVMRDIENYIEPDYADLEKSLTNLNANLASIAEQIEGLNNNYKEFSFALKEQQKVLMEAFNQQHEEFSINFNKQQMLLHEEMVKIRVQATKIRNKLN